MQIMCVSKLNNSVVVFCNKSMRCLNVIYLLFLMYLLLSDVVLYYCMPVFLNSKQINRHSVDIVLVKYMPYPALIDQVCWKVTGRWQKTSNELINQDNITTDNQFSLLSLSNNSARFGSVRFGDQVQPRVCSALLLSGVQN